MPQSLAKLCVPSIVSTKAPEPVMSEAVRADLQTHIGDILRDLASTAIPIDPQSDHMH